MSSWTDAQARLAQAAPDVLACWLVADRLRPLRRELRRRVTVGAAPAILAQQEAVAEELASVLAALPETALRAPGGEEDWNVAQAFAHATAGRRFLPVWAAMAAAGEWPTEAPPRVVPSIPGRGDADRQTLLTLLDKSRHSQRESAARIAGHELDRCALEHPLIGRLRCGEWLLFAGVHDLMHLEQLHHLAARFGADA